MARNLTVLLVGGMLIAIAGRHAPCQASPVHPAAASQVTNSQPMPAYEVATIKPPEPNGFALPLRVYIQNAFGIPGNSTGWVIGPDWINSAKYVIKGKPSESMQQAMQAMTNEQRFAQQHLMMQSLLADRFHFKAHFETREMPVYELIIAKGGPKLKENPDTSQGQMAVGASMIRAKAAPIKPLLNMLSTVPDIGGRVVIDKTGLSGTYDFLLKWTPMQAAAPSGGANGTPLSPDAETVSLFTAIEDQLGLKLVPARTQGQVLVIDHIERPSEN
ncbi:MAG TPA: TIGR03435 family protein [Acidobacteriaceae bacterium]|jgi:uncharacterized protein (TIGR03435 family)